MPMERTELREAFFAEVRRDPYAAMIFKLWTQAWAEGYEQALRDARAAIENGSTAFIDDLRREKRFSERCADAAEWLTGEKQKAEANAMIALAQIISKLEIPPILRP